MTDGDGVRSTPYKEPDLVGEVTQEDDLPDDALIEAADVLFCLLDAEEAGRGAGVAD